MSAFEVDATHIDVMVSAALQRVSCGETMRWYHGDIPGTQPGEMLPGGEDYASACERTRREVTSETAETWGATLLAENRRSVNHRYNEDEIEEPYIFTEYSGTFDPGKMLSAISCYEYQSCEHPGWQASEAKAFCDALRNKMVRMLPGYKAGPWEVTDASQVTVGDAVRVWRRGMPLPR